MSRAEAIVEQARGPVLLRVARDVAKAKYDCVLMRPTDVVANGRAVWRAESGGMQMYYSVESSWYITDSKFTPEGKNCFAHVSTEPDEGGLLPTGLRRWKLWKSFRATHCPGSGDWEEGEMTLLAGEEAQAHWEKEQERRKVRLGSPRRLVSVQGEHARPTRGRARR